jgi:hypothetical protein
VTPRIQHVLELTDRVQAAIDAGDWQRANELETERRAQLEQLVVTGAGGADLTAGLDELQQRTHRLIGLTEHQRRRVLREATMVSTGHAASGRSVIHRSCKQETGKPLQL